MSSHIRARHTLRLIAVLGLLFVAPAANAQVSCSLSTAPMNFGTYLPMAPAPLDVTGQLQARCGGGLAFIRFEIGPGQSGNALDRTMTTPGDVLRYNLYTNAARTNVFGDGAPGTSVVWRIVWGRTRDYNVSVYGRVFPGQDPRAGPYNDNLLVTVVF